MTDQLQRLHSACIDMESYLWSYIMRPSPLAPKAKGVFQDSSGTQSFREMLDAERARQVSARGGNGVGEMLYRELVTKIK